MLVRVPPGYVSPPPADDEGELHLVVQVSDASVVSDRFSRAYNRSGGLGEEDRVGRDRSARLTGVV